MEEKTFEGRHGQITLYAFRAIQREGKSESLAMPRCSSVWQMAELV